MLTTEPPRKPYKENKIISKKRCANEVGTWGVSLVSVLEKTPAVLRTTRSYPESVCGVAVWEGGCGGAAVGASQPGDTDIVTIPCLSNRWHCRTPAVCLVWP